MAKGPKGLEDPFPLFSPIYKPFARCQHPVGSAMIITYNTQSKKGSRDRFMATIVENAQGRRMVRLSSDDVLSVVSLYQQHLHNLETPNYQDVKRSLDGRQFYLPEDI